MRNLPSPIVVTDQQIDRLHYLHTGDGAGRDDAAGFVLT